MLSWSVTYKNKKKFDYDLSNPNKFNIANIDPTELDIITIKDPAALVPALIVHFDEKGKKPIYVIRNELPNAARKFHTRCHIVGWQMNVNGKNVQSIHYVFETIGRKVMIDDPAHPGERIEVIQEMCWIESAGKFDRGRDSWFKTPSEKQLSVLGSKVGSNGSSSS